MMTVDTVEIIIFSFQERPVGIELSEVLHVGTEKADFGPVDEEGSGGILKLNEVLGLAEQPVDIYLTVRGREDREIRLSCPHLEQVATVTLDKILPVPEYVGKREHPALVWGFCQLPHEFVMLVTFNDFSQGSVHYGGD
jgi:hypothetical protein